MTTDLLTEITNEEGERYVYNIPLNELINILKKEQKKYHKLGYSNLQLNICEYSGIYDIFLYGDREFNEKEIRNQDRIDVILRVKEKTMDGLTREELMS